MRACCDECLSAGGRRERTERGLQLHRQVRMEDGDGRWRGPEWSRATQPRERTSELSRMENRAAGGKADERGVEGAKCQD